jgi:tRNA A37 threonylcarbamoyladenosine dehydratase
LDLRYQKCKDLFTQNYEKITKAKILIIGVGGVGSFALDCLYKTGITDITIVDYDSYEKSNLNRQIGAQGAIGELKTKRLKEIYPKINTINKKVDIAWVKEFDFTPYNIVIDACDTTPVKVELAKRCYKKLIMSLGSANRYDFSKIEISKIFKTHTDPLARKIRYELKKAKFNKNFTVIFSKEEPVNKNKGSFVGVTVAFGLAICSQVIKKIIKS